MDRNYDIINVTSEYLYNYIPYTRPFRRPRVADFADIFKIAIMFIKAISKDLKNLK